MVRVRRHAFRSLFLAVLVTGCGSVDSVRENSGDTTTAELRGMQLANSIPRPNFFLIDTEGVEFDFHARTEGYATLLFFGYTNCPDVCPVHMANIAAALGQVGWQTRRRVKVVFAAIQAELNLPPSVIPSDTTSEYEVGHAAQVLAFSPSGMATIAYPFGTRQADWVHDLPLLAKTHSDEATTR
jgi:protein SCO1/2